MLVPEISAQEAKRLLNESEPPRLIDVRESDEWEICHLPGATLLPLSRWPAQLKERLTDPREQLIVYCHHGQRSQRAAQYLWQCGFTHVKNLTGGIDAWAVEIDSEMPRY